MVPIEGTAKVLLDEGADPIALNDMNATPLHAAAVYGNIEIGQLILKSAGEKGQSLKKKKFSHITLFPKVKEMIARENLLNSQDVDGNTALHNAIQKCDLNNFYAAKTIISRKKKFAEWIVGQPETNLEIQNKDGKTPLDLAKKNKDDDIVTQIEKKRKV